MKHQSDVFARDSTREMRQRAWLHACTPTFTHYRKLFAAAAAAFNIQSSFTSAIKSIKAGRPLGRGFVLWAVLCGHAPLPERFCVWAAFCGAVLLTRMLVGCLWGLPSAPSPPLLILFHGVGGGPWDNQQFGRATFGVRFCACGPCSVVMPRYQSGFVCGPLSAGLSC